MRLTNVTLNPTTPEAYNSFQKVLRKKVTIRFKKHHPIHKVHSSLQKVLEKEGKNEIDKCNPTTPEAYNSFQSA